jgi:hypothetical protein
MPTKRADGRLTDMGAPLEAMERAEKTKGPTFGVQICFYWF